MFAKTKYACYSFFIFAILFLIGCNDHAAKSKAGAKMTNESLPLIQQASGYLGDALQWQAFLSCWHLAHTIKYKKILSNSPTMPYLPLIKNETARIQKKVDEKVINVVLENTEKRLGLVLPKSYKDFIRIYQPEIVNMNHSENLQDYIGFYAPTQLDKFAKLMPELTEDYEKYSIDADDFYYNQYGVGQDDAQIRTKYIRDTIIIGRYGTSNFELIYLYPQVKTSDGEMQAGMRFHSGEFRAPSFAELMRQLSVLETMDVEHVPPYPQTMLKGLCADKLTMQKIWWK